MQIFLNTYFTGNVFYIYVHPELTRVRSIRFLLFEMERVLVYNSTIFKLTDLFILYFLFKMYMPTKKYIKKKLKNYV